MLKAIKDLKASFSLSSLVVDFEAAAIKAFRDTADVSVKGHIIKAEVQIDRLVNAPGQCEFTTFVALCPAVLDPVDLSIGVDNSPLEKVPFSMADYEPRKLVVCMSRMYLFENWQLLFTSLEIYRHFGADLMVAYVESVISDIAQIMSAYENEGFLKIKPGLRMFRHETMPYDPNSQTEWRNQLPVYNSCLYEFKESAEFIMFADWDDVFIPNNYHTTMEELIFQSRIHPSAGALVFPWKKAHVTTSENPLNFNISITFSTLKRGETQHGGKYVAIPSRVHGTWIHAASKLTRGYEQVWLAETPESLFNAGKLSIGNSSELYSSFEDLLSRHNLTKIFSRLPSKSVYYPIMVNCYSAMESNTTRNTISVCPGPHHCDVPQLDIKCMNLRTEFRSRHLLNGVYVHQRFVNELYESSKGCML
ncbi:hypothetical protein QR680_015233 [Steinernema hermaphroditum]|uniref:Glycosyltransferase family 92 protein n=1 Tax=Steinernema hermaphroditum TaxID=289476 RepID=A0AA39H809_9BILA|nr:hypothetical protein QR680_015233 [Steinernema hermaphroditum]